MGIFTNLGNFEAPHDVTRPRVTPGEKMLAEGLSKTIQCRIYEDIGGHYVLIYKRNVSYRREALRWGGAEYVLNKDKVIYEREVLTQRLRPVLLFRYNEAAPMGLPIPKVQAMEPKMSDLRMDARKVATVANKHAWKNLYPSTEAMLQLIAMVSVVGLLVSVGLNAYLLGDPEASGNLRNIVSTNDNEDNEPETGEGDIPGASVRPNRFTDPGDRRN